jgi:hypothetical protein
MRAPGRRCRDRCRSAASTSCAAAARRTPSRPTLIHCCNRGRDRQLPDLQALRRGVRKLPPVALRDLLDFRRDLPQADLGRRGRSITEIRKRLVAPGISLGALARGARDAVDRDEPHRRANPTAARAARTRRAPSRAPTATTRPRRSSRSPRAGSASPRNI